MGEDGKETDRSQGRDTFHAVLGAEQGSADLYSKVVDSLAGDKEQTFKRFTGHTTEGAPEQD